jgi:hypothetical protein
VPPSLEFEQKRQAEQDQAELEGRELHNRSPSGFLWEIAAQFQSGFPRCSGCCRKFKRRARG